jgi:hypothetical protein
MLKCQNVYFKIICTPIKIIERLILNIILETLIKGEIKMGHIKNLSVTNFKTRY